MQMSDPHNLPETEGNQFGYDVIKGASVNIQVESELDLDKEADENDNDELEGEIICFKPFSQRIGLQTMRLPCDKVLGALDYNIAF